MWKFANLYLEIRFSNKNALRYGMVKVTADFKTYRYKWIPNENFSGFIFEKLRSMKTFEILRYFTLHMADLFSFQNHKLSKFLSKCDKNLNKKSII